MTGRRAAMTAITCSLRDAWTVKADDLADPPRCAWLTRNLTCSPARIGRKPSVSMVAQPDA
ncbi:MAG: hypothetical protein M3Y33_20155 [Actinomycetota bacterium]|nr:hypothetical protein [Actinomycetota bacterium]